MPLTVDLYLIFHVLEGGQFAMPWNFDPLVSLF